MEWHPEESTPRSQRGGILQRPYQKSKDAFLLDYKRLIDYACKHKFDGIVIWGFLRDVHGGTIYSKELCRYAVEREVGIMPGVGTYHYGGYFFEGSHRYNLSTFLQKHPEFQAVGKDGNKEEAICPSKEGWQRWLREGMRWLYETFEIKGVNIESNEGALCHCKDCKRAREEWEEDDPDSHKIDFLQMKPAVEAALEINPNSWVTYATYIGFDRKIMENPPKFVKLLPDNAIAQWTLTHMLDKWPEGVRAPTKRSTAYGHFNGHISTGFDVAIIKDLCRRSIESGMEGVLIYGERPDANVHSEVNYLAFEEFSSDPDLSLEEFAKKCLTPLYGNEDAALDAMKIMLTAETQRSDLNIRMKRLKIAKIRLEDAPDRETSRRWGQLVTVLEEK